MSLTLDPLPTGSDPWTTIILSLAEKIASEDLSFVKYLTAIRQNQINVFTNMTDTEKAWDPPLDECPAIMLTADAHPGVEDHGAGQEIWFLDVGVEMKLHLAEGGAEQGYQACYELVRTIFAGWRQGLAIDPLSALQHVADYQIEGEVMPRIVTPSVGRYTARCFFLVRFKIADTILG